MSYIDSQIRELREIAEIYEGMDGGELLKECADTIESLYKKLTEKSTGGWIPCSERLPEEPFGCLVTVIDTNPMTMEDFENILPYHVGYDGNQWNNSDGEQIPFDVIAWQPLPEAYHG